MVIYKIKNKINGKIYIGQHSSVNFIKYWGWLHRQCMRIFLGWYWFDEQK